MRHADRLIDLNQRMGAGVAGVKTRYGADTRYAYGWSEKMTRLVSGGWVEVET